MIDSDKFGNAQHTLAILSMGDTESPALAVTVSIVKILCKMILAQSHAQHGFVH